MKTGNNIYYVSENIPRKNVLSGKTKLRDYAEKWLESSKSALSPKTYSRYGSLWARIDMGIGHIALKNLTACHLDEFYGKLSQVGANRRTGGSLSEKTVLHHHRLISSILKEAVRERIIPYNVADKDHLKQPRAAKREIRYLNEDEARELIRLVGGEPVKWRTIILLLLSTGMRRGELLGLKWGDIDFANGVLGIRRASQYLPEYGIITTKTKTKESERYIRLSEQELEILRDYREWWLDERTKNLWGRSDRLFLQKCGKPMHPDSVTDWTSKFCEKYKFRHFSPHALRHTNISLSIAAGISIKHVSVRVGHTRVSTTTDIYTHSIKSAEAKAAQAIGGLILGEGNPPQTYTDD